MIKEFPNNIIKAVIHETPDHAIIARSYKKKDGSYSKNTLIKVQLKDGSIRKHRGLALEDMLIIKRNWAKVLKALSC